MSRNTKLLLYLIFSLDSLSHRIFINYTSFHASAVIPDTILTAVFTKILARLDFSISIVERFFTNFIIETPEITKDITPVTSASFPAPSQSIWL